MDTNILLIKSISQLQKTKRDDLAEFCRLHNLAVGCTGRRGQPVKPDFVDAIWAYVSDNRLMSWHVLILRHLKKQRFVNNNGVMGGTTHSPQKRTNDEGMVELQHHDNAVGNHK